MVRNKSLSSVGMKVFYAVSGTTDPASGAWAQAKGLDDLPQLYGNEKFDTYESTRLDQMEDDDTTPNTAKEYEPTFQDQGYLEMMHGMDEDVFDALKELEGTHAAFKVQWKSGRSMVCSDALVELVSQVPGGKNEQKIRTLAHACTRPVTHRGS